MNPNHVCDPFYCSRRCEWRGLKYHQRVCGQQQQQEEDDDAPSSPALIGPTVTNPFTRLKEGTWLHGRPFTDVYTLLIDAYRLRMEDDYEIDGVVEQDNIYAGKETDGRHGFQRFLWLMEERPGGLLPPGWSPARRNECLRFGLTTGHWSDLAYAIDEEDVVAHYGDPNAGDHLKMFAAEVYGFAPGRTNWAGYRLHMANMEKPGGFLHDFYDDEALLASEGLICG